MYERSSPPHAIGPSRSDDGAIVEHVGRISSGDRSDSVGVSVALVQRAPGEFRSIEELFETVAVNLPPNVRPRFETAPRSGAGLPAIWENLRWVRSLTDTDIVHVTGDIHYALLGVKGARSVLTVHDFRFIEESRGLKRLAFWFGWIVLPIFKADRVTVISETTKQRLLAWAPFAHRKLRVIPNCIGADFQPVAKEWPDVPRILLVGTTPNKNLEQVVEACAGLNVQLAILGRLHDPQRALLDRCGLPYTEYYGLTRAEVIELYTQCDLLVFASTYEGFGMPILEAQAIGRPVVTSNQSPMREVADDGALLVDPLSHEDIRRGILNLLDDASLRATLVARGYANAAKYSATAIAAQYAAVYQEVIQRR
jgi:glycosyltransferase involved in cell wall biosynthesis